MGISIDKEIYCPSAFLMLATIKSITIWHLFKNKTKSEKNIQVSTQLLKVNLRSHPLQHLKTYFELFDCDTTFLHVIF